MTIIVELYEEDTFTVKVPRGSTGDVIANAVWQFMQDLTGSALFWLEEGDIEEDGEVIGHYYAEGEV